MKYLGFKAVKMRPSWKVLRLFCTQVRCYPTAKSSDDKTYHLASAKTLSPTWSRTFFWNWMFTRCGCAPSDLHQKHNEHVTKSLKLVINHVLNIPRKRSMSITSDTTSGLRDVFIERLLVKWPKGRGHRSELTRIKLLEIKLSNKKASVSSDIWYDF